MDRRTITAHHEAAHAVAAVVYFGEPVPIRIMDPPEAGLDGVMSTRVASAVLDGDLAGDGSDREGNMVALYAGYTAELELGVDEATARQAADDDFHAARYLAETHDPTRWIELARDVVREHWPVIEVVAVELLRRAQTGPDGTVTAGLEVRRDGNRWTWT